MLKRIGGGFMALGRAIKWTLLLPVRLVRGTLRGARATMKHRAVQVAVLALLLLVGLGVFADQGPLLRIEQIHVEGTRLMAASEVTALSGIPPGTAVTRIWPPEVERRMLRDPRLASAEMHYEFPTTIRLTVHEKTAEWLVLGQGLWGLTRGGELVPLADTFQVMPIITGLEHSLIWTPYRRLDSVRLRYALRFIHEVEKERSEFLTRISEVNVEDPNNLKVVLTPSGTVVSMGYGMWPVKVTRLLAALPALTERRVIPAFMDIRAIDQIIVTPKQVQL